MALFTGVAAGLVDGVTAATTAVEADAAAAVLVVSKRWLGDRPRVVIDGSQSLGGDPMCPALAPVAAAASLLKRSGLEASEITAVEMMEAFAVQAIACVEGIGLDPECVNRRGGALARGHPIGASGAILAVRLFHDLKQSASDAVGLAAIAAAGGIGSARTTGTRMRSTTGRAWAASAAASRAHST